MYAHGNSRIMRNPKPVLGRYYAEPKTSWLEAGIKSIIRAVRVRVAWMRFAYIRNTINARKES
jgi:hypothetical protein